MSIKESINNMIDRVLDAFYPDADIDLLIEEWFATDEVVTHEDLLALLVAHTTEQNYMSLIDKLYRHRECDYYYKSSYIQAIAQAGRLQLIPLIETLKIEAIKENEPEEIAEWQLTVDVIKG